MVGNLLIAVCAFGDCDAVSAARRVETLLAALYKRGEARVPSVRRCSQLPGKGARISCGWI